MKLLKIINLKILLKNKEELKIIKITFIVEAAGKICGGLKAARRISVRKNFYRAECTEFTTGNLGGYCNPPDEVQGAEFRENLEVDAF